MKDSGALTMEKLMVARSFVDSPPKTILGYRYQGEILSPARFEEVTADVDPEMLLEEGMVEVYIGTLPRGWPVASLELPEKFRP